MSSTSEQDILYFGFPEDEFRGQIIENIQSAWSIGQAANLDPDQYITQVNIDITLPDGEKRFFGAYLSDFLEWKPEVVNTTVEGYCELFQIGFGPGSYSIEFTNVNSVDSTYFFPGGVAPSDYGPYIAAFAKYESLLDSYTTSTLEFDIFAKGLALEGSDFTNDGYDDVLFFNPETRTVGQFSMIDGSWSSIGNAGTGWEVKGFGRFDGDDNSIDILWFNASTGAVGRFDMVGGVSTGWNSMGRAGSGWEVMGAGDFNGDDIDDVLWYNAATGSVGQYRVAADGSAQWRGVGGLGADYAVVGIADIDADGFDDVLLFNETSRVLGHFRMREDTSSWGGLTVVGEGYEYAFSGDFDGDGHDDVLVINQTERTLGFYNMADDSATWTYLGSYGADWTLEGTGDFNGDGNDDILWRHQDGRVGQYLMDGADRTWELVARAGEDWDIAF